LWDAPVHGAFSGGSEVDRNVRWLGFGGVLRATGLSLILPYFALYLRNVLGLGFAEIGVLLALTGVLPLLVVPFAGLLTDRVGRRRVFLLSLAAEGSAVLAAAYAMELRALVPLVVAVTGVTLVGTIAQPAISAYVADFVQGSDRTRGFTWLRIGWNVGFTAGVLTGGSLIGLFGFVLVGVAAGAFLLAGTLLVTLELDPSPYDLARRAQALPAPTGPRPPSLGESFRIIGRDRPFLALCMAVAISELTIGQWGVTFPLFVNSVLHIPYALLGAGLALNGVLVVVLQAPTTQAAIGHRHTSLFALGTALYAAGFLLLAVFATVGVAVLLAFFAAVFVLTMGENVGSIPTTTLPSNLAPATEIGAYNGAFSAFMGVGQLLAPTVGGVVLAFVGSPLEAWALLSVPVVPALVMIAGVGRRLPMPANRA